MLFGFSAELHAQARIFYSDLDSGPKTGGENGLGAYVTIYGNNFGASQGSSVVTVGGGAAGGYRIWSNTKIVFQLGPSAATGNIVVSGSAGASNGIPFTVRAGNIYFVSTSGNDGNAGSFSAPWLTLPHAVQSIAAGDVIYAMNGVSQTADDGQGWSSNLTLRAEWCGGTQRALAAYPGATVTIGSTTNNLASIRSTDSSAGGGACAGGWTFGELYLPSSNGMDLAGGSGWRIVGNEMTCPNGNGAGACFEASQSSVVKFYGNYVHNTGTVNASALYQGVYFTTDSVHLDIGWNTIAYVRGCRGLQIHSSPLGPGGASDPTGHNQYDIAIHDNVIHDTQCDGMILATVDPSQGAVQVYNNLIYNAGQGPNNPEGSGGWTCISVPGTTNNGPAGGGTVEIYGNTLYNCGSFASPPYGGVNGGILNAGGNANLNLHIRDNIIDNPDGAPYVLIYQPNAGSLCADSQNCAGIYGSNNLFYGAGAVPTNTNITASVGGDPLFVAAASANFHLSPGSPAALAGTTTPQATDLDGVSLPQGSAYPIGAYALATGKSPGITVSMSPLQATLTGKQSQSFSASVTGSANTSVLWSMSPAVGTLSSSGVYTAPSIISAAQTVTVTATSAASSSVSATAKISLVPVAITISPSVALTASQTHQFTATVTGSSQTGVTWTMSPSVGTITASGLYTAPASISAAQTVTITATSVADGSKVASAAVTLSAPSTPPSAVAIAVSPTTATIGVGGSVALSAKITGTTSTAVTWSMSPSVGSISAAGMYTAPSSVSGSQQVTVKATSSADPTKSATAIITVNPAPAVTITVSPATGSLSAGGKLQFTATVANSSNTGVSWSISPAVGQISGSGLYTAPSTISGSQTVTVKAVSSADSTKSATATITLTPPAGTSTSNGSGSQSSTGATGQSSGNSGQSSGSSSTTYTAAIKLVGNSMIVSWTVPSGANPSDCIAISGLDAPGWWMIWSQPTGGKSGSATIPVPSTSTPGIYEVRYFKADSYTVLARSAPLSLNNTGFTIGTPATAAVRSSMKISWTAGAGRMAGDYIGLYLSGATSDQSLQAVYTAGKTSGTATFTLPAHAGTYELRYILGTSTQYTYLSTVISKPIVVK